MGWGRLARRAVLTAISAKSVTTVVPLLPSILLHSD